MADIKWRKTISKYVNKGEIPSLKQALLEESKDLNRIQFTYACYKSAFSHVEMDPMMEISRKCEVTASGLKDAGKELYLQSDYDNCLIAYTQSMVFAEKKDMLALLSGNKSAVYFHQRKFQYCIDNIALAFSYGCSEKLAYKLRVRKAKCFVELNKKDDAIENYREALLVLTKLNDGTQQHSMKVEELNNHLSKLVDSKQEASETPIKKIRLTLASSHSTYLSLSSSCSVVNDSDAGRFIRANKDIYPGEIVVIERPYASTVLRSQVSFHCHHCTIYAAACRPCQCCTFAVFCSEKCEQDARHYHKYESKVWHTMDASTIGKFGFLVMKTLFSTSGSAVRKCEALNESTVCDENRLYRSDDYSPIYNLVGHSKNRDALDILTKSLLALYMAKVIECFTSYLSDMSMSMEETATILLRHLQSFPCNAHEISELALDRKNIATSTCTEIGAGIYATLSLFNHSCDPNVTRSFEKGDTCVVRAIQMINAGEEVSDNYGAVYATHTFSERQNLLKENYFFTCQCVPCKNNWALYDNIPKKSRPKCINCSYFEKNMCWKVSTFKCPKCQFENDILKANKECQNAENLYISSISDVLKCKTKNAKTVFCDAIEVMGKYIHLPYQAFNNCQEGLKQTFNLEGNFVDVTK